MLQMECRNQCGNAIDVTVSNKKFCSDKCRKRFHDKNRVRTTPGADYAIKKVRCARFSCTELFVPRNINHRFHNDSCRKAEEQERDYLERMQMEEDIDPAVKAAAVNELVRERDRILQSLQRKIEKEEARTAVILMHVRESLTDAPYYPPVERIERRAGTGKPTEAHLMISDTQAGKLEKGVGMDVLFDQYIPSIIEKTIRIVDVQREEGPVDTLHLHLLGDLIENCQIFSGQKLQLDMRRNGQSSIDQVMEMAKALAYMVREFSAHFSKVNVYNALGNHGRMGARFEPSLEMDNLDRLTAHITKISAPYDNVTYDIPEEAHYSTTSLGWNIGGIHSHQMGSKQSLNQMELTVLRWDAIKRFSRPLDLLLLGHRHHPASLDIQGIELIQNGAADGGSDWFTASTGKWSGPSQELFFISEEFGLDSKHRIYLTKRFPRYYL